MFSLGLLGRFALQDARSGEAIPVTSRKARALLAYLALAPGCGADRATLAALLWGDSSEEQARQSLRQALSSLRRIQLDGIGLVQASDEVVALAREVVDVDVLRLLHLPETAGIAELTQVCERSREPFGAGLETGEDSFDDWLRGERQRLLDRAIVLQERLVKALEQSGQQQSALSQAHALLALNPLREETHRLVIALEAVVSGRAAAMQRYEAFRLLLRDELAVRPEAATLKLIDDLRDAPDLAEADVDPAIRPAAGVREAPARKRPTALIVMGVMLMLIAAGIGLRLLWPADHRTAEDRRYGRALVGIGAIEGTAPGIDLRALDHEAELAFSRNNTVTLIEFTAQRRPDYRVRSRYVAAGTAGRIEIALIAADNGEAVWSGSIPSDEITPTRYARELYDYVTSEIVLREARRRAASETIPSRLWRARAGQLQTRLGTEDAASVALYESVLAEDPTNVIALLGLSDCHILRVARNQSKQRAADIASIDALLIRVKPLVPNSSDIAFKEGMLNKLQGKFEQASRNFAQSVRLDPAHWNAAAQYAHVMIFLGRLDEGFALMQVAAPNLLPSLGAAETAYIAGETALVSRHYQEAARYLGMAVSGNPTVGRIQALYAVALFQAGQLDLARDADAKARQFSPGYTPDALAQRGGRTADPRYVAARDDMAAAFRQLRALQ